jgi:hypothetical protein
MREPGKGIDRARRARHELRTTSNGCRPWAAARRHRRAKNVDGGFRLIAGALIGPIL